MQQTGHDIQIHWARSYKEISVCLVATTCHHFVYGNT